MVTCHKIDNWKYIEYWSEFWICRSFILFLYFFACYLLSYIPNFVLNSINIGDYSNSESSVNDGDDLLKNENSSGKEYIKIVTEFLMIWLILWLQVPITNGNSILIDYISHKLFMVNGEYSEYGEYIDEQSIGSSISQSESLSQYNSRSLSHSADPSQSTSVTPRRRKVNNNNMAARFRSPS